MNTSVRAVLIVLVGLALFLFGGLVLLAFVLRTGALLSLEPREFLLLGACGNDVHLLDSEGNEQVKSDGFLYQAFDPMSLADIPQRKVLLVDRSGTIKMSIDDIGVIPNVAMMILPLVLLPAALYLFASLSGIGGEGILDNLSILAHASRWAWFRLVLAGLLVLVAGLLAVNGLFSSSFRRKVSHKLDPPAANLQVTPGTLYSGEFVEARTEEVNVERHQTTEVVTKWCIRLTGLYRFPIYVIFIVTAEAAGGELPPESGATVQVRITQDYRLELAPQH